MERLKKIITLENIANIFIKQVNKKKNTRKNVFLFFPLP